MNEFKVGDWVTSRITTELLSKGQKVRIEEVSVAEGAIRLSTGAWRNYWEVERTEAPSSEVDSPQHYNAHPSGVECITITQGFNFNVGNAVKYLWRAGLKTEDPTVDLEKAKRYIDYELARVKK